MGKVYDSVTDGVPFLVEEGDSWRLACCDCGLVHDMRLDRVRGGIKITTSRNGRSTGNIRRWGTTELQAGDGSWELVRKAKPMKKRRVMLMLEVDTATPISMLRKVDGISLVVHDQMKKKKGESPNAFGIEHLESCDVIQAQANVIREKG